MHVILECTSCGRKLKVPDTLIGRKVKCTDCAHTFTAEKPQGQPPPRPQEIEQRQESRRDERDDHDDDDERPLRRSSRRRSRGDYDSHRGGMVMAFGIISIVAIFVSGGAFFAVGPFAGMGSIFGLIFGIMAWVMGGKDMREINSRRMDPDGRGLTQAGYYMGIIGTILHLLAMLCSCGVFLAGLAFFAAMFKNMPPGGVPPGPPGPRGPNRFEAPPPVRLHLGQSLRLQDYFPPRPR